MSFHICSRINNTLTEDKIDSMFNSYSVSIITVFYSNTNTFNLFFAFCANFKTASNICPTYIRDTQELNTVKTNIYSISYYDESIASYYIYCQILFNVISDTFTVTL